ncbi:unnamed protein product [Candidula unifasciata]|uniref:Decapping nuclease n=1 Tax=Candidula unifasciata TaxID=100452 RepID=A0A8S3YSF7_9EUPU|nr:unnamed protein product [Candidula unifasciata]
MKRQANIPLEHGDKHSKSTGRNDRLKTYPQLFDKAFPYFREPVENGCFSLDARRQFRHDSSQLRVFSPPADWKRCLFDLRSGYGDMIKRDETKKEYLDDLLRWIMCNKHKFMSRQKLETTSDSKTLKHGTEQADIPNVFDSLNTDFICWRGLLTRLLCIPYENREDLLVAVVRFRGTYFMCEFDTERKKQEVQERTPKQEEMCAWGFKFEQYVTADKSSGARDTKLRVNTNTAFCSVARSRLGSHSIVFGAEVDCQDGNSKRGNVYVELKTSRVIESQRQYENFCKFKLIKWWAQSFLIGIPRIVCGFRDDNGVVQTLQNYPVHEIPAMVKACVRQPWKPSVCFNFLEAFLQFVKANITTDDERCVYLFRWQPGSDVICQRQGDDPEFYFLPDWFTSWDAWGTPLSQDHQ